MGSENCLWKDFISGQFINYSVVFFCSSKKVTGNQSKENINTQEMTAVKTTSSMAATNPGAIES